MNKHRAELATGGDKDRNWLPAGACMPSWPWTLVGFLMRHLPLR